ncbi:DUF998 domain-containing protein [Georgenia alba]|uniref:DUF998 domain-containing protein n=1 Tax=Georgenia alba TaxID=2233858 RepID=A0ABW2Q5P5_9MICO
MSSTTMNRIGTAALTAAPRTDRRLLAGAIAGPFFAVSTVTQMVAREGFDLTRHPVSQLATGSLGWVQIATFALTGLAFLALATGMRRRLTGFGRRVITFGVGVLGVGYVVAGVFPVDPQNGFPAGAPEGSVADVSWHAAIHLTAAVVAYLGLAVACIAAAVRAVRSRAFVAAALHGLVAVALLLPTAPQFAYVQLALTSLVAFSWITANALVLRRRTA